MESIWTKTVSLPSFPALEGDVSADIAIVGGGLAGILTADFLRREGASVVVIEADRVGGGQTAGTTAKLTAQHGLKYSQLTKTMGLEAAGQYAGPIWGRWRGCGSWCGSGASTAALPTAQRFYIPPVPRAFCRRSMTPVRPSAWTCF